MSFVLNNKLFCDYWSFILKILIIFSRRRSFRIKKKDEEVVTIRPKPEAPRPRPTVKSYSYSPEVALPRSRFKERLSLKPAAGPNPFDEDEENSFTQLKETKRKHKKRAPLPPKSVSSQDVSIFSYI